jgi:hypothetical protein
MDADDGPCHELASPSMAAWYDDAVELNSSARPSQAAAAVSIGPGPAPAYMRPELISGGNAPNSIDYTSPPDEICCVADVLKT